MKKIFFLTLCIILFVTGCAENENYSEIPEGEVTSGVVTTEKQTSSVSTSPSTTNSTTTIPATSVTTTTVTSVRTTRKSTTKRIVSTSGAITDSHKIYRTPTGKKYHYANPCGNGDYYEITLDEALAAGLEPCKKCVLN